MKRYVKRSLSYVNSRESETSFVILFINRIVTLVAIIDNQFDPKNFNFKILRLY